MDGKNFDRERRGGKGAFNGQSDTYSRCLVSGRRKTCPILKAGDVIVTHDGVKHWHGAAKTAGSTYRNHSRYARMVGTCNG